MIVIQQLPGILICVLIAVISVQLGEQIPVIGGTVFALLIGIILSPVLKTRKGLSSGFDFTSKRLLKFAIILLGFSLSIGQIFETGKYSLMVMVFTLSAAFGFGHLFGKLFKMNWKLSTLISAGTGICGGSAIAALSSVIEADESDITYAISATFIFDLLMIVLFPIMGRALGLSDLAYGLWTGTAVNDTSSVVAAGYAFSNAAGNFATIVKLTRTLSIIPTVMFFSYITQREKQKQMQTVQNNIMTGKKISIRSIFPYFIIFFLLAAVLNSIGLIPMQMTLFLKSSSKFLIVTALAAIGLKTNLGKVKDSGWAPMLHGFIISALVVIVSLAVQIAFGQV